MIAYENGIHNIYCTSKRNIGPSMEVLTSEFAEDSGGPTFEQACMALLVNQLGPSDVHC